MRSARDGRGRFLQFDRRGPRYSGPKGDGLRVKAAATATIRFIGSRKGEPAAVLQETTGIEARYRFTGDELYVRAVATSGENRKAWTRPGAARDAGLRRGVDPGTGRRRPPIRHPVGRVLRSDGRIFVGEDPWTWRGRSTGRSTASSAFTRRAHHGVRGRAGSGVRMLYLEGRLYVQHVPKFSVFRDDGGVAGTART